MDIALVKVLGDIDIRCAFTECLFVKLRQGSGKDRQGMARDGP